MVHIPGAQTISWKIISYPSAQLLPGGPVIHKEKLLVVCEEGWAGNPDLASPGVLTPVLHSRVPATSLSLQTSCGLISDAFCIYFPPLSNFCCFACIFDSFGSTAEFWIAFKNIFSGSSTRWVGCEGGSLAVLQGSEQTSACHTNSCAGLSTSLGHKACLFLNCWNHRVEADLTRGVTPQHLQLELQSASKLVTFFFFSCFLSSWELIS